MARMVATACCLLLCSQGHVHAWPPQDLPGWAPIERRGWGRGVGWGSARRWPPAHQIRQLLPRCRGPWGRLGSAVRVPPFPGCRPRPGRRFARGFRESGWWWLLTSALPTACPGNSSPAAVATGRDVWPALATRASQGVGGLWEGRGPAGVTLSPSHRERVSNVPASQHRWHCLCHCPGIVHPAPRCCDQGG